jgi:hypothetical protein
MRKLSPEEIQELIDEARRNGPGAPKMKAKPAGARNGNAGGRKGKTKANDSPKPDWLGKSIKGKGQTALYPCQCDERASQRSIPRECVCLR